MNRSPTNEFLVSKDLRQGDPHDIFSIFDYCGRIGWFNVKFVQKINILSRYKLETTKYNFDTSIIYG